MAAADTKGESKRQAPPYIAFQTLKTLTQNIKADGMPGRIDKSMLKNFSGAVASQLMTALKFLGLTDQDGHPLDPMKLLVSAYGTDEWSTQLGKVLRSAFAPLFALDLQAATPNQFNERFAASFEAEGDTMRKAITFFVNAARDAQIPISTYIIKNKKPRSAAVKKRVPKMQQERGNTVRRNEGNGSEYIDPPVPQMSPYDVLMKTIYDPNKMKPEEEQAVFTLVRYLRMQEAK